MTNNIDNTSAPLVLAEWLRCNGRQAFTTETGGGNDYWPRRLDPGTSVSACPRLPHPLTAPAPTRVRACSVSWEYVDSGVLAGDDPSFSVFQAKWTQGLAAEPAPAGSASRANQPGVSRQKSKSKSGAKAALKAPTSPMRDRIKHADGRSRRPPARWPG